jgi:hypothetical protein
MSRSSALIARMSALAAGFFSSRCWNAMCRPTPTRMMTIAPPRNPWLYRRRRRSPDSGMHVHRWNRSCPGAWGSAAQPFDRVGVEAGDGG